MNIYSIHEASQKLTTSPKTLKQWENKFKELLVIPRTKNGARFYTDKELSLLLEVKNLYAEKRNTTEVKKTLSMILQPKEAKQEQDVATKEMTPPVLEEAAANEIQIIHNDDLITKIDRNTEDDNQLQVLLSSLETYKQDFLHEVKQEIRNGIKQEVLETISTEIQAGKTETIEKLSSALADHKDAAKEEMEHIAEIVHTSTQKTTDDYESIKTNIRKLSQISKAERKTYSKQWTAATTSTKEIKAMMDHLSKSNSEINKTVEQLHKNDRMLMEAIQVEREQMSKDIKDREKSFQELVQSFRQTAVAEPPKKTWWKIWHK
ncbi:MULTISPECIES: MerR family transcriptional regulator [unclassified Niallia]|uniref:MerR family transcriptional regulator n=1 Tax=Niallia TaxID=2837506 RepID=UPI001EDBA067|nr:MULTISPECIES: MerR family transcriptional regulator [unclassified Niallia]MCM3033860.1 MerR family transcriptional regulator [Niallia sp. MER 6]MDL0436187.1 MerR family transcriptional regulator [Niallia sp. SS-2023]UPO86078.1 MerR family transcriptional regulator [Niallia sp. Man26]